ncbi:glycosyltransferase family 4 protein [Caldicellulosiruptor acetigenus]|uniref:glycosyltransferase family 4 protein n=1 Tax=Caldicellulosiruptor acetigenus TaxID=301953 RepID=UPI0004233C8C|nr:glycosyltransferase family 4 protein [Caldicellulosiruptor acetigenus]WAM35904.1 glycosyltransferase family 4 protein [Caldicellulosiruptor acetigenus]
MNILILNTYYYPNIIGGTEESIKLLAEGLSKKGHNVIVFSADGIDKSIKAKNYNGVTVVRTKGILYKNKSNWFVYRMLDCFNPLFLRKLSKVIEQFKIEVVLTNNLFFISPYVWKFIKKKHNLKVVHTIRDIWLFCPKDKLNAGKKIPAKCNNPFCKLYRNYIKFLSGFVDAVCAPSNFILNFFISKGYFKNAQKRVIPNSIDFEQISIKNMVDWRIRNLKTNKRTRFLYMGRLSYEKGIINLLNAFEKLECSHAELLICGRGPLENEVKKLSSQNPRIKYFGFVQDSEKEAIFSFSDVLVFPSLLYESFGRVIIEAYAHGLPVIATNVGAINEIVNDGKTGLLIEPHNENLLVEAMKKMCDKNLQKAMLFNIITFISRFQLKNQLEMYEEVFG